MKKIYYKIFSNDGCSQSGEIKTLKEAKTELKNMIQFDEEELGVHEGEIDYYIEKYTEVDGFIDCEEVY